MPIRRSEASISVLEAARARIKNTFANGLPVYMSFSGGKDSLTLAVLVEQLIQAGEIDPKLLTVLFIDEEAIFPCIEQTTKEWRQRFMLLGAKFEWFCIEVKHFNCFNALTNDESFICWDSQKEDVWVRRPPPFAIREHPLLYPREETYQSFVERYMRGGISVTGVRAAESIQRLRDMAKRTMNKHTLPTKIQVLPIYDWTDKDVWLFLLENNVHIPEIYLFLWQSGQKVNQLRVSQFFSIDTARSLVSMNEYYPDLMERIIRREPNAYLASLYWDSEMFGRRSRARRELESGEPQKDYRAMLEHVLTNMDIYFATEAQKYVAKRYKRFYLQSGAYMDEKNLRGTYEALMRGDPKLRALRALYTNVHTAYADVARAERREQANG